ncbi:MAG: glycosyltransferase [Candidatus Omnitrophota bacterium]|nr:glycosyltransferase [Candidatus Omnitrophota bacterium]
MYISEQSGHHQASLALEKAILKKDRSSSVLNINAFRYTSPIMERLVHKAYMEVVKKRPEIWGYLYDNPEIVKKTERLRDFVHNINSGKFAKLIEKFRPDAVACTQAFPCGIMADYKRRHRADIPLIAVLTDYAPHAYWIYENVDTYVVPSPEIGRAFIKKGVPEHKIKTLGMPIDPIFNEPLNKNEIYGKIGFSPEKPVVLIMGGAQGIGPNERLIRALNGFGKDLQVIVVTGINAGLFRRIKKIQSSAGKKLLPLEFARNVHELMEISDVIITKAGGLTTAEALAKLLPMIILNPLPGQEDLNTKMLMEKGIAVKAQNEHEAVGQLENLLGISDKAGKMREAMRTNAKPYSSSDIAKLLLGSIN